MKKQESIENYLETILILSNRLSSVRSIDIVKELGYSKPSISVAMKNLRTKGYINMDDDGYITLTTKGNNLAKSIYERHIVLSKALMSIGIREETAKEDACLIEHIISEESFEKIKLYLNRKIKV
ncbi:metal-dependent transcriptional regulator [Terrisporobacter petrolearius]|uniref:metal-dependent transcriptional regulator n=1 Tax=Terrisporobacter petrolearius TaxID=1460447 RepID=UPI001D16725D|nr:metal-dependent transcriptional regulator [Terrisporobacter petrolearius]MCC3864019.1 metal-dependent transcriptional regulator [Terrisporobacter petrolearius]